MAAYVHGKPELAKRVVADEPDLRAELAYQRDCEMAIYPADSLFRRTRLALFHATPLVILQVGSPAAHMQHV